MGRVLFVPVLIRFLQVSMVVIQIALYLFLLAPSSTVTTFKQANDDRVGYRVHLQVLNVLDQIMPTITT